MQVFEEELLVKEYAERCGRVCRQLFYLSAHEGRAQEASRYSTAVAYSGVKMGEDTYKFYDSTEKEER